VKRPEWIARQAARPSGVLGRLLGRVMAVETAEANRLALELLEPRRTDHVLEIGFGHGATIERLSRTVDDGVVAGIDVSHAMLKLARRRNCAAIARGRVQLSLGSVDQLPHRDAEFDRVLSVHTLYFWPEPQRAFAEIRRVLKPSGRLVLGWRDDPESRRTFPASVYSFQNEEAVAGMLREADLTLTGLSRHERGGATLHFAVARNDGRRWP
jgi:SAM-dependent methyltransferase